MAKSLHRINTLSKTAKACRALRQLAHEVGSESKLPSVNVLCDSMGISRVTLYQALDTLERQGVIIRKHGKGIYASPEIDQKTIGILFGTDPFRSGQSPFAPMVLDHVRKRFEARGGTIQFYVDTPYAQYREPVRQQLMSDVDSGRVRGIILIQGSGPEQARWLIKQGVPFVGSFDPTIPTSGIKIDHGRMVRAGVDALVGHGRQRIGLVAHNETRIVEQLGDTLRDAFDAAHAQHGLTVNPNWVVLPSRNAEEWTQPAALGFEELAYRGVRDLFNRDRSQWPDGLVMVDDMMARGALAALTRMDLRIPEDIMVATHANRGSTSLLAHEPKLIRFESDPALIGDTLLDMLEELMMGRTLQTPYVDVPWTLRDIKVPDHG